MQREEQLVKLVYTDGDRGSRTIIGYIVDEDEYFRTIERQKDRRRIEISKSVIIKQEDLEEE